MKKLAFSLCCSVLSVCASAQQDQKHSTYMYHNKSIAYGGSYDLTVLNATAILYRDSLYKQADMKAFLKDKGLITEDFSHYERTEDIKRITGDTSIRLLFVFKEEKQ